MQQKASVDFIKEDPGVIKVQKRVFTTLISPQVTSKISETGVKRICRQRQLSHT